MNGWQREHAQTDGLSIIELLVAVAIGLFLVGTTLAIYFVQTQGYKSSEGLGLVQNAEGTIASLLTPYFRGAGFAGCGSVVSAVSNLTAGGSAPLGSINTTNSPIAGYHALANLSQVNAANASQASGWSPSLDTNFLGNVETGSDVVVVLGAAPGTQPISVTSIPSGSTTLTLQSTPSISTGQYAAVSDCAKASLFEVTAVTGTTLSHSAGSGSLHNASNALSVNFSAGAQFVPMQQTAFFVGYNSGGQSALMMATLSGGSWTVQPILPGVDSMKVLYGIGANGVLTQYVTAPNVTNWAQVYAVRIGFLIEGQSGSGGYANTNKTQFSVLGQTITVPADTRLRQVYELTINLRNTTS